MEMMKCGGRTVHHNIHLLCLQFKAWGKSTDYQLNGKAKLLWKDPSYKKKSPAQHFMVIQDELSTPDGDDEASRPIAYDIPMYLILSECNLQRRCTAKVARDLEQWTPDLPAKVLAIVEDLNFGQIMNKLCCTSQCLTKFDSSVI